MEGLSGRAGASAMVLPCASGSVLTAVRSGDAQFAVEILAPVIGQVKAGAVRALAVTTSTRTSLLPDVPSVAESGVPGYEVTSWNGIAAPAKTPRSRIDALNRAIVGALGSADVKQRFQELGVEARPSTPEAFQAHLKAEIVKWKKVIEEARIPKQ